MHALSALRIALTELPWHDTVIMTLVRRNGITNYHLIAYSFSNISAENYQNRYCRFFLRHSVHNEPDYHRRL